MAKKYMQVTEQDPGVLASHPLRNQRSHDALLSYCKDRIQLAVDAQKPLRDRFYNIDKELSGFLELSADDRKRQRENIRGKSVTPTEMKPQLALVQLGRGVTYLASVFSPSSDMFRAISTADAQQIANAFVEKLNNDSVNYKYFRQQCLFFLNCLKYNLGGLKVEWKVTTGKRIVSDPSGAAQAIENAQLYDGNAMTACDPYNTFWDPSVHPCDAYSKGEYAGEMKMLTEFQFKRMIQNGEVFNTGALVEQTVYTPRWYNTIPQVRFGDYQSDMLPDGTFNWAYILSAGSITGNNTYPTYEMCNLYIRLIPGEFNLIPPRLAKDRNQFEIWRITIVNQNTIVATQFMNNIHDQLPYYFGSPLEDNLGLQTKSHGENLIPFQNFAAFLLNSHVNSTRKNIWDITIYDPSVVDLSKIGRDVTARIAVEPTGFGKNIQQAIWQPGKVLDTQQSMRDFEKILEFMEYMFPTKMLQQVADVQRATTNQAAAIIQAAAREQWKNARMLDDQAMSGVRFAMLSNACQYQTEIKLRLPGGQVVTVNALKFRDAMIEFGLGERLRDVDYMEKVAFSKDMINTLLQTQAFNEFDVPAIVNYLSSLGGIHEDLTQFRRVGPAPGQTAPLNPDGTPAAAPGGANNQPGTPGSR